MKLLIADDHALVRDVLVNYMRQAMPDAAIKTVENFEEAVQHLKQNKTDLLLLEWKMPGMMGVQSVKMVVDEFPNTKVALMSGIIEKEDVKAAIELGAKGYLPKTMSVKNMLDGIFTILSGERFYALDHKTGKIAPSYLQDDKIPAPKLIKTASKKQEKHQNFKMDEDISVLEETVMHKSSNNEVLESLSPRELQVLERLDKGASNKEIAKDLHLEVVTIKLHLQSAYRKIGAKNRTHAALKAKSMGLF